MPRTFSWCFTMERLETFWTWRSCECAVCHGSHGTVGDSASWGVEALPISLESVDLCRSPLKEWVLCWPSCSPSIHIVTLHGRKKNRGHDGYGYIKLYLFCCQSIFGHALVAVPWCSMTHSGTPKEFQTDHRDWRRLVHRATQCWLNVRSSVDCRNRSCDSMHHKHT